MSGVCQFRCAACIDHVIGEIAGHPTLGAGNSWRALAESEVTMRKTDNSAVALVALTERYIEQEYIDQVAIGNKDFVICVVQEDAENVWIGSLSPADCSNFFKKMDRVESAGNVLDKSPSGKYWLFVLTLSNAMLSQPDF